MGQVLSQSLVNFVPGHLALLYHVSRDPDLTMQSEALVSAITRYRNFMFLRHYDLAQHTNLGIEWIWHVHRLHPLNYIRDCHAAYGRILGSQYQFDPLRYQKMDPKKEHLHLVEYFDMDYNQIKAIPTVHLDQINRFTFSVDLLKAAIRQKTFVHQAYIFYDCTRKNFMKFEKDYILFLELMKKHPKTILVPTLAIDLIWHTHMRVIEDYIKDTRKLLDQVLDHNDDLPQTYLDSYLELTQQLWKKQYKKTYLTGPVVQKEVRKYKSSYDDGILKSKGWIVIGVWGYPYYMMPCYNSHWNWEGNPDAGGNGGGGEGVIGEGDGGGIGDSPSCGGGVSCGGSTCGGGGVGACGGAGCGGGGGCGSSCGGGGCGGGCGG